MVSTSEAQHRTRQEQEDYENRRAHPRIAEPPLYVAGLGSVRDVSLGGMAVKLEAACRAGEQYEVILTDADFYYTKSLRAEVVWAVGRMAGLKWVDLTDDQVRWLHSRFHDWSRKFETTWIQPVPTKGPVYRVPSY
jgi:hypothetical protein